VAGYSGDAGDALTMSTQTYYNAVGMMFSTADNDNDLSPNICAQQHGGGWWFWHCSASFINRDPNGFWYTVPAGAGAFIQETRMLVKRN